MNQQLSRRGFLKLAGITVAGGVLAAACQVKSPAPVGSPSPSAASIPPVAPLPSSAAASTVNKTVIENSVPEKSIFEAFVIDGKIYAVSSGENYEAAGKAYAFDPLNKTWQSLPGMPEKKLVYGSACLNNRIYMIGGFTAPGTPTGSVEVYDPADNTWAIKSSMPTDRGRLGIVVMDGAIYALGGEIKDAMVEAFEAYDPERDQWTVRQKLPFKLAGIQAVAIQHKIYAIYGHVVTNQNWIYIYIPNIYDPVTDLWKPAAHWAYENEPEEAIVVNDRLFIAGGGAFTNSTVNSMKEYDLAAGQWQLRSKMPVESMHNIHFNWTVVNGKIYTFGGGYQDGGWQYSQDAKRYDPVTDTWEELEPLSEGKLGMGIATIGNKIFLIGGEKIVPDGQNPYSDKVEIYEVFE